MGFDECVRKLLIHEGVDSDHPQDKGGRTKFGISKSAYPNIDIPNLTKDQAIAIYRRDYWDKMKCDQLPSGVAHTVFDMAVNMGPARAGKILQESCGAKADGIIGSTTIAKANAADHASIVQDLASKREVYYRSCDKFPIFGKGWLNRTEKVKKESLDFINRPSNLGGVDLSWNQLPSGAIFSAVARSAESILLLGSMHSGVSTSASLLAAALFCGLQENAENSMQRSENCLRVAFSLDAAEPTNPEGPNLRKVYYPPSLAGTALGDVLFEADYLLKRLSMGLEPIPPALAALGFVAGIDSDLASEGWNRLWFVPTAIEMNEDSEAVQVLKVTFGVEARGMVRDTSGTLVDAPVQGDSHAKRFAALCTVYHAELAAAFPVIDRLKDAMSAVLLAKFILNEGCSLKWTSRVAELRSTAIGHVPHQELVPALRNSKTTGSVMRTVFGGVSFDFMTYSSVGRRSDGQLSKEITSLAEARAGSDAQTSGKFCVPLPGFYDNIASCVDCSSRAVATRTSDGKVCCQFHRDDVCAACFRPLWEVPFHGTNKDDAHTIVGTQSLGYSGRAHAACFRCKGCAKNITGPFVVRQLAADQFPADCYHSNCIDPPVFEDFPKPPSTWTCCHCGLEEIMCGMLFNPEEGQAPQCPCCHQAAIWTCGRCTLINSILQSCCEACGSSSVTDPLRQRPTESGEVRHRVADRTSPSVAAAMQPLLTDVACHACTFRQRVDARQPSHHCEVCSTPLVVAPMAAVCPFCQCAQEKSQSGVCLVCSKSSLNLLRRGPTSSQQTKQNNPITAPTAALTADWNCGRCTFRNSGECAKCTMCDGGRAK